MILKENSGRPPPTISSRPETPVGSLFIFTLSWLLTLFSRLPHCDHQRLRLATHFAAGLTLKARQGSHEEVRVGGDENDSSLASPILVYVDLRLNLAQAL